MSDNFGEVINSAIWAETAEPDNPFAAALCRCHGYDVYGDLLGNASFIEYLYLLFRGQAPTAPQADALNRLALALANPGPRDPSVHAAMAASVAGAPAASILMATLAVGAGSCYGGREVYFAMIFWREFMRIATESGSLDKVTGIISTLNATRAKAQQIKNRQVPDDQDAPMPQDSIWPQLEHQSGFDPYGVSCATPVRQTLAALVAALAGDATRPGYLAWLAQHQAALEAAVGRPLSMVGVTAAALLDLGFSCEQGEMFSLLLRLPGAAVHALEQAQGGFRQFPFFELDILNDPGPVPAGGGQATNQQATGASS